MSSDQTSWPASSGRLSVPSRGPHRMVLVVVAVQSVAAECLEVLEAARYRGSRQPHPRRLRRTSGRPRTRTLTPSTTFDGSTAHPSSHRSASARPPRGHLPDLVAGEAEVLDPDRGRPGLTISGSRRRSSARVPRAFQDRGGRSSCRERLRVVDEGDQTEVAVRSAPPHRSPAGAGGRATSTSSERRCSRAAVDLELASPSCLDDDAPTRPSSCLSHADAMAELHRDASGLRSTPDLLPHLTRAPAAGSGTGSMSVVCSPRRPRIASAARRSEKSGPAAPPTLPGSPSPDPPDLLVYRAKTRRRDADRSGSRPTPRTSSLSRADA